jgi:hypothetical protein
MHIREVRKRESARGSFVGGHIEQTKGLVTQGTIGHLLPLHTRAPGSPLGAGRPGRSARGCCRGAAPIRTPSSNPRCWRRKGELPPRGSGAPQERSPNSSPRTRRQPRRPERTPLPQPGGTRVPAPARVYLRLVARPVLKLGSAAHGLPPVVDHLPAGLAGAPGEARRCGAQRRRGGRGLGRALPAGPRLGADRPGTRERADVCRSVSPGGRAGVCG